MKVQKNALLTYSYKELAEYWTKPRGCNRLDKLGKSLGEYLQKYSAISRLYQTNFQRLKQLVEKSISPSYWKLGTQKHNRLSD